MAVPEALSQIFTTTLLSAEGSFTRIAFILPLTFGIKLYPNASAPVFTSVVAF